MSADANPEDATTAQIERLLTELVRPLLARDGGDIELVSVRGSEVVVRLIAACAGCPGAGYTTEAVLVPLLRTLSSELTLRVEHAA